MSSHFLLRSVSVITIVLALSGSRLFSENIDSQSISNKKDVVLFKSVRYQQQFNGVFQSVSNYHKYLSWISPDYTPLSASGFLSLVYNHNKFIGSFDSIDDVNNKECLASCDFVLFQLKTETKWEFYVGTNRGARHLSIEIMDDLAVVKNGTTNKSEPLLFPTLNNMINDTLNQENAYTVLYT